MKKIFLNLFWPAVAGNVVWAFFTVAIDNIWSSDVVARLTALLLLSFYLAINWCRIQSLKHDTGFYWFADGLHLITIIVFAIASQLEKSWLECSLAAIFVVTIFGHLCGAWEENSGNHKERFFLAGANALGIVVLFIGHLMKEFYPWSLPVAVLIVLIAWAIVRWCILPADENNPCKKA